jgi:hypothetical protein
MAIAPRRYVDSNTARQAFSAITHSLPGKRSLDHRGASVLAICHLLKQMPKAWHHASCHAVAGEAENHSPHVANEWMAACTTRNREMIRITKSEEGERTIITLEGQLSRDYIEVVEVCFNQAVLKGKPIDVFLHDLLTIDESGRGLLIRLAANGIRLLANGIYTSYIVRALMSAGAPGPVSSSAAGVSGEGISRKFEGNHR